MLLRRSIVDRISAQNRGYGEEFKRSIKLHIDQKIQHEKALCKIPPCLPTMESKYVLLCSSIIKPTIYVDSHI